MNGPQHYKMAEGLLVAAETIIEGRTISVRADVEELEITLQLAQVHAMLANTAAIATHNTNQHEVNDWYHVLEGE